VIIGRGPSAGWLSLARLPGLSWPVPASAATQRRGGISGSRRLVAYLAQPPERPGGCILDTLVRL